MSPVPREAPETAPPPGSRLALFVRRFTGLLILAIGLAVVVGSLAVILGRVGAAATPWRQVFRAMGGALAAVASTAFALGGLALITGNPRLRMFTAWAGVQGMAMAMGCLIASLLLDGSRQIALAGSGALTGAVSVYALGQTVFRSARWSARPAETEDS